MTHEQLIPTNQVLASSGSSFATVVKKCPHCEHFDRIKKREIAAIHDLADKFLAKIDELHRNEYDSARLGRSRTHILDAVSLAVRAVIRPEDDTKE